MSKVGLVTLMRSGINDTSSSDTLREAVEERVAGKCLHIYRKNHFIYYLIQTTLEYLLLRTFR